MKILFVSTEFEEPARGITGIIKSMVIAAKAEGHEVGVLVGYPLSDQHDNELLDLKVEHLYLQHYFETGKKNIFPKTLGSRRTQLKIIAGRQYLAAHETRINHKLVQKNSSIVNLLDYIVKIPYVYHFINHGFGSIAKQTLHRAVKKYHIDLVITGAPMDLTKADVAPAKLVQFVHDTMPIDMLETPADNQTPQKFAKQLFRAASEPDAVLTNSLDTNEKVLEINPEAPTHVLYGVASNKAANFKDDTYLRRKSLKKDNYLLFVSVIERRKNIDTLLDAYMKAEPDLKMPLVIVGGKGFGYKDIMAHYNDLPDDIRAKIIFTGYISETDKYALMNNARAFVFPSVYEGLGIPIIEAFSSGLPVLTTNRGALPEAGGKAALYIDDPYDIDELANAMVRIATDEKLRETLRKHEAEQIAQFTQEKFNERFGQALESIQ